MNCVQQYNIPIEKKSFKIQVPVSSVLLKVDLTLSGSLITFYFLCNTDLVLPKVNREFVIYQTGYRILEHGLAYVGTVTADRGREKHIFEKPRDLG